VTSQAIIAIGETDIRYQRSAIRKQLAEQLVADNSFIAAQLISDIHSG